MTAMQSEYPMRFVFSKRFYILLAVGFVPLSLPQLFAIIAIVLRGGLENLHIGISGFSA